MEATSSEIASPIRERYPDLFTDHRDGSEFFNPWQEREKPKLRDLVKWQLSSNPWKHEKAAEEPVDPDPGGLDQLAASSSSAKLVWLGHAGFYLELDGFRCVIDPVYGTVGAFVKRFSEEPFPLDDLPGVDAVLLTHGHYDHLDVQTLERLADTFGDARFIAPIGQSRYVPSACGDVVELDWWTELDFGGVRATFVPSQHWHRRGPFDYNKALWGGWVFQGSRTIFHAGDSGYFEGFEALGEAFDIDTAILPVGAYEPRWFMREQHMNPEEALRSFRELRAEQMVAMHWGTYDLTDEPLNRGADEIRRLAGEVGLSNAVHVPRPGGFVSAARS